MKGNGIPILQPDAAPSGVVKMTAQCGCGHHIALKIPVTWFLENHVETLVCPECGVVWRQQYRVGVTVLEVTPPPAQNGKGDL